MCDTIVVTPQASQDGVMLFGKNSDRQPNEAHQLADFPAADHPSSSQLKCTYITISQVEHTHAVLLAKPFWMWGAEMGANEHGVAIGNEAVFTKVPAKKEPALIGMDLLRLALERAATAQQAVQVITTLLEQYGQGGNCGYLKKLEYDNSYLIADPQEAWVLETAGSQWAAKQVHGIYTISNRLSLQNDWDIASPDLVNYAIQRGWCKSREDFDFDRCYSAALYTYFGEGWQRSCCTRDFLGGQRGETTVTHLMQALREHGEQDFRPDRGITGQSVCMHAGFGPIRSDQTTGSMVSHLHPQHPTHFLTGTAAPCTSLFVPVWLDAGLPQAGLDPAGDYDPSKLYWQHEMLHRLTLENYPKRHALYARQRDALEAEITAQALEMAASSASERLAYSATCFERGSTARQAWISSLVQAGGANQQSRLHRTAWSGTNKKAQIHSQLKSTGER